jgi:hypothetical protein
MKALAAVPALLAAACAVKPVYLNRDVVRVAVLPPFNNTDDLEASGKLWPHVENAIAHKGYHVIARGEVSAYYQKLKFTIPEEIEQIPMARICEELKVQGLVFSRITFWGKKVLVFYNYVGVEAEFWLVDPSGERLWAGQGENGEQHIPGTKEGRILDTAAAILADPGRYAAGAAANGCRKLPLAGFAPAENK